MWPGKSIGKAEKKGRGYILLPKETRVAFVCGLYIHKASFLGALIGHGRFRGGK